MNGKFSVRGALKLSVHAKFARMDEWGGVVIETRYKKHKFLLRVYLSEADALRLGGEITEALREQEKFTKTLTNTPLWPRLEGNG